MSYKTPGERWLRRVILRPYRKGTGPHFVLTLWDARLDTGPSEGHRKSGNHWSHWRDYICYSLDMCENGRRVRLFEGADYSPSPGFSLDGDKCVAGLLGFLTLRPGDTDDDYFAEYTPEQLAFCAEHAEVLSAEVLFRFAYCEEE